MLVWSSDQFSLSHVFLQNQINTYRNEPEVYTLLQILLAMLFIFDHSSGTNGLNLVRFSELRKRSTRSILSKNQLRWPKNNTRLPKIIILMVLMLLAHVRNFLKQK